MRLLEFERDKGSNALINTDRQSFEEYKRLKKQLKKTSEMENDINSLKNELREIKNLLKCIVDRTE